MPVVGQLVVALTAKTGAFRKGMESASKRLDRFGRQVGRVGQRMVMFSAVPMGLAVKGAIDFETQMAKVATMVDKTSMDHLPRLSAAVRQLSVDMGQSTQTLTDSLYDILSGQIAISESTDVLAAATKAGVAGMSDTATATKAIVTVLNAYQLQASEATRVSDLLFAIIYRGRGTFEDFAPAIGNVAAIAANAGLSMEEMAAALATMTRAGVETQRASTALSAMLMAFLKPTEDAKKAAEALGITLSINTLRSEGLVSVIRKLSEGNAELTAKIIPTRRALRGLMAILQNTAGYYKDLNLMMSETGRTQETLDKISKTTAFQLKRLWQAITALGVGFGETLLPAVNNAIEGLNAFITANAETIKSVGSLLPKILLLGAAFKGVGIAAKVAAVSIATFKKVVIGLALGFTVLAKHPIALGIAALAGGFVVLAKWIHKSWKIWKETDEVSLLVAEHHKRLAGDIENVASEVSGLTKELQGVADAFEDAGDAAKAFIGPTASQLLESWAKSLTDPMAKFEQLQSHIPYLQEQIAKGMARVQAMQAQAVKGFGVDKEAREEWERLTGPQGLVGSLINQLGIARDRSEALRKVWEDVLPGFALDVETMFGDLGRGADRMSRMAVSLQRPAALEMGTAGAYTAGVADPVYKAMERDASNTAKNTKAALPELREIVRVLRNPQPTEVVEIQ